MLIHFRQLNSKAQNITEYTLLLTLVAAGIIIAAPTVYRAWNAHVKSYEEDFTDSMNDPFLEDTVAPPPCVCTPPVALGCGDAARANGCYCNEQLYEEVCSGVCPNPVIHTCVPDNITPCCCDTALPGCDVNAAPQCPGGCPLGQACHQLQCGSAPVSYACRPDACFKCEGLAPNPTRWLMCPGDDIGLLSNTPIVTIETGACSSPAGSPPKCQGECVLPFRPVTEDFATGLMIYTPLGGKECECPDPYKYNTNPNPVLPWFPPEAGTTCGCAAGWK